MTAYLLKLLVMLPLVAGLAWGALLLWRRVQPGMMAGGPDNGRLRVVDAAPLGLGGRLAVVEFDGRRLLLAVTRGRVEPIAEGARTDAAL